MSLLPFRQTPLRLPVKFGRMLKCSPDDSKSSSLTIRWNQLQREIRGVIRTHPAFGNLLVEGFGDVLHNTMPKTAADMRLVLPPIIDRIQVVTMRAPERLPEVVAHLDAIIRGLRVDDGPNPQSGRGGNR